MGKEGEPPYTPSEGEQQETGLLAGESTAPYVTLESTATRLGLTERMANPEVRQYVGVVNALEWLQVETRDRHHAPWVLPEEVGDPNVPTDIGDVENIVVRSEPRPDLATRYRVAEGLITAAVEFMQHGFGENKFRHEYILGQYLEPALTNMGLRVRKIPPFQYDERLETLRKKGNLLAPQEEAILPEPAEGRQVLDIEEYRKSHPKPEDEEKP